MDRQNNSKTVKHYQNANKGFRENHKANRQTNLTAVSGKLNKAADTNNPQKGMIDQDSRTDVLPQTGTEKHNSLAMLALGSLALATALGAAWLNRKKD